MKRCIVRTMLILLIVIISAAVMHRIRHQWFSKEHSSHFRIVKTPSFGNSVFR